MALNDIYRVSLRFDGPSGNHSSRLYYQETVAASSLTPEVALATRWESALKALLLPCLAPSYQFNALVVEKAYDLARPKYVHSITAPQSGSTGTDALPSNNAQIVAISQARYSAKSNGRMFFPPPPESETVGGVLTAGFMTTAWDPFVAALVAPLIPDTGTGEWQPGVISQKVLNAAPPAKDWLGSFCPAVSMGIDPVVGIQRRRQSKREGRFSAT